MKISHFQISILKSALRLGAVVNCVASGFTDDSFKVFIVLFGVAEAVGIIEELTPDA